jgi:FAD/FMN-containing dehydrogenase
MTHQIGLGIDQWLEANVVTADEDLKVANAVSNPDLLWALRGGGGATFGIVVEATIKAHHEVPVTGYNWYSNSTKPAPTPEQLTRGETSTSAAMQYLFAEMPTLHEKGISAYFYVAPHQVRAFAIHPGKAAGLANANAVWGPILEESLLSRV